MNKCLLSLNLSLPPPCSSETQSLKLIKNPPPLQISLSEICSGGGFFYGLGAGSLRREEVEEEENEDNVDGGFEEREICICICIWFFVVGVRKREMFVNKRNFSLNWL